jgi:hypothetical protein
MRALFCFALFGQLSLAVPAHFVRDPKEVNIMAKNIVVTREVAEKFVDFVGTMDYLALVAKLPEFNKTNKAKYALDAMLTMIDTEIYPLVELHTAEKVYDEQGKEVVAEPEVTVQTEATVETSAPAVPVTRPVMTGIDLTGLMSNINKINAMGEAVKNALVYWTQGDAYSNGINKATLTLGTYPALISKKEHAISVANENVRKLIDSKFEDFYTNDPIGKLMKSVLDRADTLEKEQYKLIQENVSTLNKKFHADADTQELKNKVAALRTELESIYTNQHELKEAILEAEKKLARCRNKANAIRRDAGLTELRITA